LIQHAVASVLFCIAFDFPFLRARIVMGSPFVQRVKNIAVRAGRFGEESAASVKA
jgi:hypothetical protein